MSGWGSRGFDLVLVFSSEACWSAHVSGLPLCGGPWWSRGTFLWNSVRADKSEFWNNLESLPFPFLSTQTRASSSLVGPMGSLYGCFQAKVVTAQEGLVSICFWRKAGYFNLFLQKLPKILMPSKYAAITLRTTYQLGLSGCQVTQNTALESAPSLSSPAFVTSKILFCVHTGNGIAGPYSNSISFLFFLPFLKKNTVFYRGSHFLFPPTVPRASCQHFLSFFFFNSSWSEGCKVVSNCGFDLHFSCDSCIEFMVIGCLYDL